MTLLRFSYLCLTAAFCAVLFPAMLCRAADNPVAEVPREIPPKVRFEVLCADGEARTGSIVAMNSEKLILSEDGKNQEIPLERLEFLQNCSENPFLMLVTAQPNPNVPNPAVPRRNNRNQRNPKIILPQVPPVKPATVSKPKISYPSSVIVLTLRDGSRLTAEKITMKGQTVQCVPLSVSKDTASKDTVSKDTVEIQFHVQQLAAVRFDVKSLENVYTPPEQWTKIADAKNSKADKLIFGQEGSLDFYEGAILEITADKVMFSSDGETLPVPIRRVAGLVFFNNGYAPNNGGQTGGKTLGHLSLWNGTEIALKNISFRDGEFFDWTSVSGISGTVSISEADRFDFGLDNFQLISDLEPAAVRYQLPFNWKNGGKNNPQINLLQAFVNSRFIQNSETGQENVLTNTALPFNDVRISKNINNPLPGLEGVQLDGTGYQNGLSIPTGTVLEYKITDNFASLRGIAGIDDRLRPQGNVRLVIQANETLLCDWIIKGYEPAKQIRFDLPKETKTLKMTVQDISGFANPFAVGIGNLKLVK